MKKIIFLFVISIISNFAFAQFPNLVASSNSPICNGNTLILSATHDTPAGGTTVAYSWTGPNNFTSTAQNPQRPNAAAVDGTYTLTLTLSGTQTGTFTATTAVFTVITPIVTFKSYLQGDNLNQSNNFCVGNNMTLEAITDYTSGVSYSWTGPNGFSSTLQAPTISSVTAANAGIYQATIAFNNSSCVYVSKRNLEITIGSPRVGISQNLVCSGGNVTLTPVLLPASATVSSYLWEGDNGFTSNASTLTINNLQERKTYKLTAIFGGGCSGTSVVYTNPQPMVPTPSVTTRIFNCNASVVASMPATFVPAELTNYSWTGPSGFSSNQLTAPVTQAGEYTFTGTISGAGCNDVFTRTVTVPRIPSTTTPILSTSLVSTTEFTGVQSSFCDGVDVILIGTNAGDLFNTISYNWTGPNGFSSTLATPKISNFSAAKAGIYSLTITGTGNACNATATATASNTLFVGHNAAPSLLGISFTNVNAAGTVFCSGNTVSMAPILNTANSNNSFGTYSWTGPNGFSSTQRIPTISNVSATNEGIYNLTATFTTGCVGTATTSASLTLSTQPSFSILERRVKFNNTTGTANCLGSTVELIAQTGGSIINSISWTGPNGFSSTALNPQIVNATAANSGYYYATINMGGECPATITRAANISFSNANLPFVITRVNTDPASDNRSVCTGNNIKLFANPLTNNYYQATYSWAGPNGFTSNDIAPTISNIDASKLGTYTLNVNYTDGCTGTAVSTIAINTNPPTFSIGTVGASSFCNGFPVTLSPTLGLTNIDTYSWTGPNGFTSNQYRAIIPSFSASNVGTYTLTINLGGSCPTTISATTPVAYETAPTSTTISFTEQITNFTGSNQCAGSNLRLSLPFLTASQITSYSWAGPSGFSSTLATPTVTNAAAGTYTATVGYLACGVVSTVTATTTLTNTKSMTLTARSQGGTNGTTSYCSGSNFELLIASNNPSYAQVNSYSWAGPNGFSSTAAVPLISNAIAANGGVYTLTANFASPCAGTVTATINITIANFQPNLLARRTGQSNAFTFCSGTNIELYSTNTPSSGTISSYNWAGPNGFSSTATSPQIANMQSVNAGFYTLTVTVSGGACAGTYTATTNLTVGNVVPFISTSQSQNQCPGGSITLTANISNQSYGTGTTYSWSGPNGFSGTSVNATLTNLQAVNSGIYTVTATYPFTNGCATSGTSTSTINLTIGVPTVTALSRIQGSGSTTTSFCTGSNGELYTNFNVTSPAPTVASYSWTGPNGYSSTSAIPLLSNLQVGNSGTYSVTVTFSGACAGTASATRTITITSPTLTADSYTVGGTPVSSSSFCPTSSMELRATPFNASGATVSYAWAGPNSFSSTAQNPQITNLSTSNAGTYTITATFSGACVATVTANKTISVVPASVFMNVFRVGNNLSSSAFCPGLDIELKASFNMSGLTINSYNWSGPNGFSSTAAIPQIINIQAANAGVYSLSVVLGGACAGTYTTSLNIGIANSASPLISLTTNSVQCAGGTVTFIPSTLSGNFSTGSTYSWSGPNNFSSTLQNPAITNLQAVNSGTYSVTVVYPSTAGCASHSGTGTFTTKLAIGNTAANILSGQDQTVTANTNFPLNFEILGGTLPITITLSNGANIFVNSTNGNNGNIHTANISVPSSQTITISSITSSCGVGTGTGSAVITVPATCPTTATANSRLQGSGTNTTSFCTGSNVEFFTTFNTTPPVGTTISYNWTGPNGYSSTNAIPLLSNIQTNQAGTYSVTVTFGGSCTGTASSTRTITVANGVLNIFGKRVGSPVAAFTFCNGSDVDLITSFTPFTLTVSSYSWTGPNGFSSTANVPQIANFQAVNNGTYSLTAVVTGACAGTYTKTVNLSSTNSTTPFMDLTSTSVQCPGGAVTFLPNTNTGDFNTNSTYSWTGPNGFSSTARNPVLSNLQPINSGIYTVTIVHTSTYGCANYTGTTTLTKTLGIGNTAANILPNQNQTVDANTNFTLNIEILGGSFPITLNLSNGSSFSIPSNISNTGNIYTATLSVPTAQTITISSMTSSCPSGTNTGSAVISIGTIPCPPNLTNYSGTFNNLSVTYKEASGDITTLSGAGATLTINSGAKLTLDSGKSILLQPGFEAKQGSVFKAHIDGCGGITN